jgi:hypothetical protein
MADKALMQSTSGIRGTMLTTSMPPTRNVSLSPCYQHFVSILVIVLLTWLTAVECHVVVHVGLASYGSMKACHTW